VGREKQKNSFVFGLIIALFTLGPLYPSYAKGEVCMEIVDDFCKQLWGKTHRGDFDWPDLPHLRVRFGRTPNDIRHTELFYLEALQRLHKNVPNELTKRFAQAGGFKGVEDYLGRKEPKDLTVENLARYTQSGLFRETAESVLKDTAKLRLNRKVPGIINFAEDQVTNYENRLLNIERDVLRSELNTSIWANNARFKIVEALFEEVRATYLNWIAENQTLPEWLKKQWKQDMQNVRLIPPGGSPEIQSRWPDCGFDTENAFYSPDINAITVCAGTMNSSYPLFTLGHEIGHVLGYARHSINFFKNQSWSSELTSMYHALERKDYQTCAEWKDTKAQFLKNWSRTTPMDVPQKIMLDDLITAKLVPLPDQKELLSIVSREVDKVIREEAKDGTLLSLLQLKNENYYGRIEDNRLYLNPVLLYRWPNDTRILSDPSAHFEIFFAMSFHCHHVEKKTLRAKAVELAIQDAKELMKASLLYILHTTSKYSDNSLAIAEGFAQDTEEDFADRLSGEVVSSILRKKVDLSTRRAHLLSAISKHCSPSDAFSDSDEDLKQVLQKYSKAVHSIGTRRRAGLLVPEIKETIRCR